MEEDFRFILQRSLKSYAQKPQEMPDSAWLLDNFQKELPDIPLAEHEMFASEVTTSITLYAQKRESLHVAEENGMGKDSWFAREAKASARTMTVQEYGKYLSGIDSAIREVNKDLAKTLFTHQNEINQNTNLDGFIFESEHASSFNMDAALKNSDLRAEVLRPEPGQTYAKNSVDLHITDGKGTVVQEVQAKCCKDAASSNAAFEAGDYGEQTRLVPDQQEQGTSVSTVKQDNVESRPLSKEEVKKIQEEAQKDGTVPEKTWNDYETKELALHMGKQAALAGLQGAAMGAGWCIAEKLMEGKELDVDELAEVAIKSGVKSGATCAVAGALKVYVEKKVGTLPSTNFLVLPPMDSLDMLKKNPVAIGMIASVAIDSVSIGYKVTQGEMTLAEGLREVESSTAACVVGTMVAAKGAAIGATIGTILGPFGIAVGGFVGGTLGYIAGSTLGRATCKGVQKIRAAVSETIDTAWEGVKNFGSSVMSKITSLFD